MIIIRQKVFAEGVRGRDKNDSATDERSSVRNAEMLAGGMVAGNLILGKLASSKSSEDRKALKGLSGDARKKKMKEITEAELGEFTNRLRNSEYDIKNAFITNADKEFNISDLKKLLSEWNKSSEMFHLTDKETIENIIDGALDDKDLLNEFKNKHPEIKDKKVFNTEFKKFCENKLINNILKYKDLFNLSEADTKDLEKMKKMGAFFNAGDYIQGSRLNGPYKLHPDKQALVDFLSNNKDSKSINIVRMYPKTSKREILAHELGHAIDFNKNYEKLAKLEKYANHATSAGIAGNLVTAIRAGKKEAEDENYKEGFLSKYGSTALSTLPSNALTLRKEAAATKNGIELMKNLGYDTKFKNVKRLGAAFGTYLTGAGLEMAAHQLGRELVKKAAKSYYTSKKEKEKES